jgi:hypothetical protein
MMAAEPPSKEGIFKTKMRRYKQNKKKEREEGWGVKHLHHKCTKLLYELSLRKVM